MPFYITFTVRKSLYGRSAPESQPAPAERRLKELQQLNQGLRNTDITLSNALETTKNKLSATLNDLEEQRRLRLRLSLTCMEDSGKTREVTRFESRMGQFLLLHGIQVTEAGYRHQSLALVPYLGEAMQNRTRVCCITNDYLYFTSFSHRDGLKFSSGILWLETP